MARPSKLFRLLPAPLAALVLLAACGNRGPLYLPEEPVPDVPGAAATPAPRVIESEFPETSAAAGPPGATEGTDEEEEDREGIDPVAPDPDA